jgi:hypothetical protein
MYTKSIKKQLAAIILMAMLISCAGSGPSNTTLTRNAKDSPSNVVIAFLEATINKNFSKAYSYIYFPGTDKQGYISGMENWVEKSNNKINNYKLISTRIIGDKSYAIYELELLLGAEGSSEQNLRYTRNQIEMALIGNHWKIVKDYCIENCIN